MAETVFGIHAVSELLERHPEQVIRLSFQDGRDDRRLQSIKDQAQQLGLLSNVVPRRDLDQLVSGRHQGVVAEVKNLPQRQESELYELLEQAGNKGLVLVLDGVTDPHNLGACLRSADASGATAVVVPKDKSAQINATVRKVACGAAEVVPFFAVTNLARTLKQMAQQGIWIVGTSGDADALIYDIDMSGPVAVVMGAEGDGMRRLTRENCDYLAKLPMAGTVSSVNVSVATGICLFEAVRQRQS